MTIATSIVKTWQLRNQREKQLLTIAAALLISWLGWVLLVNPALRGRAHWQRELPGMQSELEITENHVNARFIDISFASFAELLQQWQITSQLVVDEVTITARDRIDRVDVLVSLKRVQ